MENLAPRQGAARRARADDLTLRAASLREQVKALRRTGRGRSSQASQIWTSVDIIRSAFGREGVVSSVSVALEITFSFDPAPEILVSALLVGGLMGVLGGLFPAVQAARTSPVEARRE